MRKSFRSQIYMSIKEFILGVLVQDRDSLLFFCFAAFFLTSLSRIPLKSRGHHYRQSTAKSWLCSASAATEKGGFFFTKPAVTQNLGFCDLIWRTVPIQSSFNSSMKYWGPILTRIAMDFLKIQFTLAEKSLLSSCSDSEGDRLRIALPTWDLRHRLDADAVL